MSIIIDNYEKIVKNIVTGISTGNIISKNAHNLQGLSVKELFRLFTAEFNLVFSSARSSEVTLEDNIIGIKLPNTPLHISNINFKSLGDLEIPQDILSSVSSDNVLYLDVTNTNVPINYISVNNVITIEYVTFNTSATDTMPEEIL